MGHSRVTAYQSGYLGACIATCILAAMALLAAVTVQGQSGKPAYRAAAVQGSVLDSRGRPVVGATVVLQLKDGTQTLTTRTDSAGSYRFSALREAVYTLRATMAGYADIARDPFFLGSNETKKIDLTLDSSKASAAQSSASGSAGAGKPEFFDEPEFTVAGVTDTTNLGGHGSDTILRSKESLAKETVALSKESPPSASSLATTETVLREAAGREPENFDANYRFGRLLVGERKSEEAIPFLERAARLNPDDYGNSYELALAYADAGKYENSRTTAQTLLTASHRSVEDEAELHHLLGDVEEKLGDPLQAVREYQRAAELIPSEPDLFDWGSELLLHHAAEPAVEVFTKGTRLFPRSGRMLLGLGVAWYARGSYDQAAQRLCEASDLKREDPTPYLFMGKMLSASTGQSECLADRLERFVKLQPENALGNYYYALTLSKQLEGPEDTQRVTRVESLLEKAVQLDPKLGAGYLQLGILYSGRKDFARAISAYQKAIAASPGLEEAHYRLAQAYRRTGEKLKAQQELQLYEESSKRTQQEVERQRHEIQQFVYTLRGSTSPE